MSQWSGPPGLHGRHVSTVATSAQTHFPKLVHTPNVTPRTTTDFSFIFGARQIEANFQIKNNDLKID